MLPASVRASIRACVPLLREHGETICRRFYDDLFAAHPELLTQFTPRHLRDGSQQRSLAGALYEYAQNIDQLDTLTPLIERIARKHAAHGVESGQYVIVGGYLLAAIKRTLGDTATPALLAAWDEAYQALASALMHAEPTARLTGA
jgi:nitric oxide dioxygenase